MATSTSNDTDHEPAEQHEPQRGRPFWELREDDKRLLLITIVGALAANVGLVLIVGLGLVEAHLIHRYRHSLLTVVLPQAVFYPLSVLVTWALSVLVGFTDFIDGPSDRTKSILWRTSLGIAVLLSAILILGLVGYAAGVK